MPKPLLLIDTTQLLVGDDGNTTYFGGKIILTNLLTNETREINCEGKTDRGDHPGMEIPEIIGEMFGFPKENVGSPEHGNVPEISEILFEKFNSLDEPDVKQVLVGETCQDWFDHNIKLGIDEFLTHEEMIKAYGDYLDTLEIKLYDDPDEPTDIIAMVDTSPNRNVVASFKGFENHNFNIAINFFQSILNWTGVTVRIQRFGHDLDVLENVKDAEEAIDFLKKHMK